MELKEKKKAETNYFYLWP